MPRVIHFEISAADPERVLQFYTNVFGWEVRAWDGPEPYWIVNTGAPSSPGIDGAVFQRSGERGYINTIDVPSVDEYVRKIETNGGRLIVPKTAIPGIGYSAYLEDIEGNVFGILEEDLTAE